MRSNASVGKSRVDEAIDGTVCLSLVVLVRGERFEELRRWGRRCRC